MITATASQSENTLSVSAALALANRHLKSFPLCIEGEVSQVSNKPGYKAVYFTIKDNAAALPCMMWVNKYVHAGVDLKVGALVRVTGNLSIYAVKGTMSFDVSSLQLAGEGDIRRKIELLKEKLAKEGLTDSTRKRALPYLPQRVGLVTSPRGAAVQDVLRTLRRRYPVAQVLLAGVPVEGAQAAQNVIAGINTVVQAGAQLVLVVRGGGSFEDLLPFNDEALARTIAACPVPVVTGIGHERDTTIADLVADMRCSTPTAAAEAISPEDGFLENALEQSAQKMKTQIERLIHVESLRLNAQAQRPLFKDSHALLYQECLGLDYCSERLARAIPANITRDENTLSSAQMRLEKLSSSLFMAFCQSLDAQQLRAHKAIAACLERSNAHLALCAAQIDSLSPLAVLGRGYSIVFNEAGTIVHDVYDVQVGDDVSVHLGKGSLSCTVSALHAPENTNGCVHDNSKH